MSHLNPSPNQTKAKTQSERQNRSERNREKRRERIGEWKKRERPLFPTTHHASSTLIPSPQPICYHGSWSLHHHATTIGPPYNLAKTHATKPTTHNPIAHNPYATTATTKPPTQRHHHWERLAKRALIWWERFEFLEREVWVFWERVDEIQSTMIHDPWLLSPSSWWQWRQIAEKRKKWEWERKKRKGRSEKREREWVTVKRERMMRYFY